MKLLPSTTDPNSFAWQDFVLLLAVVAVPGLVFFIYLAFFRKPLHRRKRHRRRKSSHSALVRILPSASRLHDTPGERKS